MSSSSANTPSQELPEEALKANLSKTKPSLSAVLAAATTAGYDNTGMDSENTNISTKKSGKVQFPWKLHRVLDKAEEEGYSDILSWLPDGKTFQISSKKRFEEEIMPKAFSSSKFKSFQRSCNLWGFCVLQTGPNKGCYFNPQFIRGKPELCDEMLRTKVKVPGKRSKANRQKGINAMMSGGSSALASSSVATAAAAAASGELKSTSSPHLSVLSSAASMVRNLPADRKQGMHGENRNRFQLPNQASKSTTLNAAALASLYRNPSLFQALPPPMPLPLPNSTPGNNNDNDDMSANQSGGLLDTMNLVSILQKLNEEQQHQQRLHQESIQNALLSLNLFNQQRAMPLEFSGSNNNNNNLLNQDGAGKLNLNHSHILSLLKNLQQQF